MATGSLPSPDECGPGPSVGPLVGVRGRALATRADRLDSVATMAREALSLRDKAKDIEAQVRASAAVPGEDAVLKFSRRFYQELEGRAPEQDLEEPSTAET